MPGGGTTKAFLRRTPWTLIITTLFALERRRRALDRAERARLAALLRNSRGLPGRLTREERTELRLLIARLDPVGAGRDVLPLIGRMRLPRRR